MNQYQIIFKKTTEIDSTEWIDYTNNFNKVFEKKFSVEDFKVKYSNTSLGYSFHGILSHNNSIVGMFSAIPRQYIFNGKEITIAMGCDAFILKKHRKDEYFLKKMADVVIEKIKEAGIYHIISIPNKKAYPYWKYYGGWEDIGRLNYYIIPFRISKILNSYKFLDRFSIFIFKSIISCFSCLYSHSKEQYIKGISLKRDDNYLLQRYSSEYKIRKLANGGRFIYRIYKEDTIRTAYIIDCYPLSKSNITRALSIAIKEVGDKIDLILFVGIIEKPPIFFLKVPQKKEPRQQFFTGLCLDDSHKKEFYNINNWDVSLANFDNR